MILLYEPHLALIFVLGTCNYMSPEVVRNRKVKPPAKRTLYGNKCDIWGLGVILFELIFDVNPFDFPCELNDCKDKDRGTPLCPECMDTSYAAILDGDVDVGESFASQAPPGSLDLLGHVMKMDPAQRYSAEDVLGHVFVKDCVGCRRGCGGFKTCGFV